MSDASSPAPNSAEGASNETGGGLARVLGGFDVTMLVMGSIVGAGVFNTPQGIAASMGSLWGVLAVWAFGGVVALTGALVFAELGGMMPHSGGEYVFVRAGAGRFAAFLFGWISLAAIVSSAIAFVSQVFVEHLYKLLSLAAIAPPDDDLSRKLIAVALIGTLCLVNARGVRLGANVQNAAMLAKLVGIGAVIALAAVAWAGWIERPVLAPTSADEVGWNWNGVGAALFGILFTYGGWQNVASVASEIRNPGRNLPLGTLAGTAAVVVLYLALNTALVAVLGVEGVAATRTPVASAAGALVSWGEPLVAALVMMSTFGVTQAMLMLAPRIYFAMAQDGVFLPLFARVHPRWGTPAAAIGLQGAFAVAHVFVAARISDLLEVCSICDWVFFVLCGVTLFVLRRKAPHAPRPYRAWGYPVLPAVFVLASVAALVRMAFSAELAPLLQALGLFAIGALLYAVWRRP
jgi:APA family basic amino acid/polyamine antiporter